MTPLDTNTGDVRFNALFWQLKASQRPDSSLNPSGEIFEKMLLTYNQSLALVRQLGYERHARPTEVIGLFCASLEEKLTRKQQEIVDDMLKSFAANTSYGEWVSLAWERQGNTLITYLDPEGLVFDNEKHCYVKKGFRCSEEQRFDITGNVSDEPISLKHFGEALIRYHYGRSFADLPRKIQRAQLGLPVEGTAWPVVRGFQEYRYSFSGGAYIKVSRGVRRAMTKGRRKQP